MGLASFACDPARSRGRRFAEPVAPTRTQYQRDRDRIIHCSAFRRLVYKTQVFLNHEGDLFRTRLTHSLEVAQLGRSIARSLGLDEDLVEAIALAHDLGHTPFGHAGQDALNGCMSASGGFEHNVQSLRVVDLLELRYPDFDGLNLTFETREGILKHCSAKNAAEIESHEPDYADGHGGVGDRFLTRTQPSLEAQLCNLTDEIAYNAHDIDDGVRSGLISLEQLEGVELFRRFLQLTRRRHPHLGVAAPDRRLLYETIRQMLSAQVYDVIDTTRNSLDEEGVQSVEAVRRCRPLVCFSEEMRAQSSELKRFLLNALYRHPQVKDTSDRAKKVVRDLFLAYTNDSGQMQGGHSARSAAVDAAGGSLADAARAVADYIAGMTDRFATREHNRLTGLQIWA